MSWQLFRDRTNGAMHRSDLPDPAQGDPDEAFWSSPVGRATRARMRGDRFFQVALDDATLAAYAEEAVRNGAHGGTHEGGGRRARRAADLLGQIEELGWRLEHVTWWRTETVGADQVKGVYLFHSVPDVDIERAPAPGTTNGVHAPSHRRAVP